MKRLFHTVLNLSGYASGRRLFLHNAVILLLFFRLCRLYSAGFWVCLLAFLLGQVFLTVSELVYHLLLRAFHLIGKELPHADHKESH